MKKGLLVATVLLAAVAAALPGAASSRPKSAGPLCRVPEPVLFTCKVGTKTVSVCGQEQGGAVYRFGRPGRVELEAADLHFAEKYFSGGGDMQVYADTPTQRYIIYSQFIRTGFGEDGHFDPKETSGLVVQSGGQIVSNRECALPATFDQLTRTLVPAGDYVPH